MHNLDSILISRYLVGMDASVAFDDIGHSDHARDLLKNFLVAPLAIPRVPSGEGKSNPGRVSSPENHFNPWNSKW